MILFGGFNFRDGGSQRELWELPFSLDSGWRPLGARGPGPAPRNSFAWGIDPSRSRFAIFGGASNGQPLDDGWILDLAAHEAPGTLLISAPPESATVESDTFHFSWQSPDGPTS